MRDKMFDKNNYLVCLFDFHFYTNAKIVSKINFKLMKCFIEPF